MKQKTIVIAAFIWIGFVCAISFMEAWLKFQAPNITLELGLGIGRLVFSALNKVELALFLLIAVLLITSKEMRKSSLINFSIVALILLLQTFWLLPVLDGRAQLIIEKLPVAKSYYHLYYIILELIKVPLLFFFGIKSLKHIKL
jgi:hypothetical protein